MNEQPGQPVRSEHPQEPTHDVLMSLKRRRLIFFIVSTLWLIVVTNYGFYVTSDIPEEYLCWFLIGFVILVGGLGCLFLGYLLKIPKSSIAQELNSKSTPISRRRRILFFLSLSAVWLIAVAMLGLLVAVFGFSEMTWEDFYWFLSGFIIIVGGLGCLFLGYVLKISQRLTIKSIGLGSLFGFIALIILSTVFWIVWLVVMYINLPIENIYIYAGLALSLIAIAYGVASFELLRRAVPKTTIHTIGKLPEIVITREGTKVSIQNQTTVKIIVAETTCILIYLLTLVVFCFVSQLVPNYSTPHLSTGLTIAVPMIGFFLGSVLAVMVYTRTTTS